MSSALSLSDPVELESVLWLSESPESLTESSSETSEWSESLNASELSDSIMIELAYDSGASSFLLRLLDET